MAKRDPKRPLPDFDLWTEVARTIDPLRPRRTRALLNLAEGPLPVPATPPPKPRGLPRFPSYQSDGRPGQEPPGRVIEPRLRRRLGRGQVEIDGTIDLHGMRQHEARAALFRYIKARSARGDRTLLVITGKGLKKLNGDAATIVERGVLRSMLPLWLSEPELAALVAGWDVAAQGHGGEGAYYIRLRRVEAMR